MTPPAAAASDVPFVFHPDRTTPPTLVAERSGGLQRNPASHATGAFRARSHRGPEETLGSGDKLDRVSSAAITHQFGA